ncbi:low molecular weight phosphotyrosine protein phosphatase [Ponticoccus sp. SC2-23]|uniref:low molecular weight protein-tyrosine-phosphatase n=1 Tax=Alexandriicola marinus TaxID=2081710 RepID=UPI000FD8E0F6|nr:low molecular weight protein-tyrosine-phosphatase [Alexandriicola marinus]MBM1222994.1 low molecular weight phosphotyrosine protein phosphatase [Ponticoccus sp. SC6-9]MBM1227455.1 low molecular weight phosphotyrosine protein phosphatase [Ponticoccus sp. SC6-15]MBM1231965.1 low molecular weight phosphotyrosine protein phosphatase [Ponticoccus sp. SC6-38]MBM1240984.1 low molecular weight phosphotyrosine protein phosphatase [Ponticoccus sp. SC6-49]MBM1245477.1 low molecular weight phosphotyros
MHKVLIVCVGNICRSPIAADLLMYQLPALEVSSAGLSAVVGEDVDPTAKLVAEGHGIRVSPHSARQFTPQLADSQDLILVLEKWHRREIERMASPLSGKVMLLSHWTTGQNIQDPYGASRLVHEHVFEKLKLATSAWSERLTRML